MRRKTEAVMKKILTAILGFALLTRLFTVAVSASDDADISKDVQMTVYSAKGNAELPGMSFRVYKVADMTDGSLTFELTEAFKDAPVVMSVTNSESEWEKYTGTLEGYVAEKNITPDASGETGEDAKLLVDKDAEGASLGAGIYLLVGDPLTLDEKIYTPKSTLVVLPLLESADGEDSWNYAPVVSPKIEEEEAPTSGETVDVSVVKVWDDEEDSQGLRPDSVTIVLNEAVQSDDGAETTYKEYARVTLDESCAWKHTFENVPADTALTVYEEELSGGYTCTVEREGDTFIVRNTLEAKEEPSSSQQPTSSIPQTGDNNLTIGWICLLAASGIMLLILGFVLIRRKTKKSGDK